MKRLSTLIWLAVFTAVIPLLALPLWLMRPLIIAVALSVAALGYSVFRQHGHGEAEMDPSAELSPRSHAALENLPEEAESDETRLQKDPLDIIDPETDRFVATNTYQSRRRRLNIEKGE